MVRGILHADKVSNAYKKHFIFFHIYTTSSTDPCLTQRICKITHVHSRPVSFFGHTNMSNIYHFMKSWRILNNLNFWTDRKRCKTILEVIWYLYQKGKQYYKIVLLVFVCTNDFTWSLSLLRPLKVGKIVPTFTKVKNTSTTFDEMTYYVTGSIDSISGSCIRLWWNWQIHSNFYIVV